jgi:hypothetical protein
MTPTPNEQLEAMRLQVAQSLIEHEIVAQALVAQCLISAGFVLVLGLLCLFLLRRNFYCAQALIEQTKRFYTEQSERDARHSSELIAAEKQNGLELSSITRIQWGEFAEAMRRKRDG